MHRCCRMLVEHDRTQVLAVQETLSKAGSLPRCQASCSVRACSQNDLLGQRAARHFHE